MFPSFLDISHLLDILQDTAADWQRLGLYLQLNYSVLQRIAEDNRGVDNRLTAMLDFWLETGKATKSSLVAALRKMGKGIIADRLDTTSEQG